MFLPFRQRIAVLLFAAACAPQAQAQDAAGVVEPVATGSVSTADVADPEAARSLRWSATLLGRYSAIGDEEDDGGVGGFLDRYDFTPDKGGAVPFEIGIGHATLDLIEDDEALLQIRFSSPTSNLGVTESDADDWFLNQRGVALGRLDGLQFDFKYHRFRTEELRIFPDTTGSGLPFTDLSDADDRFKRTRTGFLGEIRWRPAAHFQNAHSILPRWSPEIAVRGGFESREGLRQLRTILNPGNDWIALGQNFDQEVSRIGTGVRVTPAGRFALSLDFDHTRFRPQSSTIYDSALPFASVARSVGFVPSSDRSTGKIQLEGRIGERLDLSGGIQLSHLEQPDRETAAQQSFGLRGPEVLTYAANATARLTISDRVTSRAWVKFSHRKNDIDRSTALFNPTNGTQVDEFLRRSTRLDGGVETSARLRRGVRFALGAKLFFVDRELEFAQSGLGNRVILPQVALAEEESLAWEVYGKLRLRPARGLMVRGELGYRGAPRTGYIVELDEYVHGDLRVTYNLPLAVSFERPVVLTGRVRGGKGENRDFDVVGGQGPSPPGPSLARKFERSHWATGLTIDGSPRDDLSLSASLFFRRDEQSSDLALSTLQRFFQETVAITFRTPGDLILQTDELSFFLGAQLALGPDTDLGASYSYVRATSSYDESDQSPELDLIDANREIEADIHGVDLSLRRRLRQGLHIQIGYGYQHYEDGAPVPVSAGSVIRSFDRSTDRHTLTLGMRLDNGFFSGR